MSRPAQGTRRLEHRATVSRGGPFGELVRALKALFDPYRPELHYMRGPGPKWHAKHSAAAQPVGASAVPAAVRYEAR
jgi:hypothetical protein